MASDYLPFEHFSSIDPAARRREEEERSKARIERDERHRRGEFTMEERLRNPLMSEPVPSREEAQRQAERYQEQLDAQREGERALDAWRQMSAGAKFSAFASAARELGIVAAQGGLVPHSMYVQLAIAESRGIDATQIAHNLVSIVVGAAVLHVREEMRAEIAALREELEKARDDRDRGRVDNPKRKT